MEFYYVTIVDSNGNTKDVVLERSDCIKHKTIRTHNDHNVPPNITDLKLHVRNKYGDTVEEDCSYDSWFMFTVMDRVAKAICKAFYWIPLGKFTIYKYS